ncbi:MAG: hypothetical protein QM503_04630 [Bacteroidota bacterium]
MDYKIKKNNHYANPTIDRLWPFVFGTTLEGTFKFSKEAWYSRDSIKNTGWNKLLGVSGLRIHNNSGCLVWQPDFNHPRRILISTYVYDKGIHKIQNIASVMVEDEILWKMIFRDDMWTFIVGLQLVDVDGSIPSLRFKAYPYFEGESKAPNTMVVTVNCK